MTQIPEWANWLARDADGELYAYEAKPHKVGTGWEDDDDYSSLAYIRETDDKYSYVQWEDLEAWEVKRRENGGWFLRRSDADIERALKSQAHGFEEPPTMESDTDIYGNANMNGGPSDTPKYKTLEEIHDGMRAFGKQLEQQNVVIKPQHYRNKDGKDLFQKWYEEHDMPTFRAIMRATAERYTTRYEHKNGIEDLEKGIETLQRLKEYEEEAE